MAPVATPVQTPHTEEIKKVPQTTAHLPNSPFERVWRGNKQGTLRLPTIPDFQGDKYAERQWIKEHMVLFLNFYSTECF